MSAGEARPAPRFDEAGASADVALRVVVNGVAESVAAGVTVAALLDGRGLAGKRVAVERNGEIVPRSRHAATPLAAGDRLEIVVAVGGG